MIEEAAVQNCQWCKMKEEDMLAALFKEEQVQHTSIHLHAYSYTVGRKEKYLVDSKYNISNRIARVVCF